MPLDQLAPNASPFLVRIRLPKERVLPGAFPFALPLFAQGFDLEITRPVTFFVGENGTGKSTLLEALAWAAGFGAVGGGRDHSALGSADGMELGRSLSLAWRLRTSEGFFLRAETFFDFATYLEQLGSDFQTYGGRSLHSQSHGEAFLALFSNRFGSGLYLLDEPEAALSPQRQLAFLAILDRLTREGRAQFMVATHSPMLMAFPGATILSLDGGIARPVALRETEHYRIMRGFLEAPERYFEHLFRDPEGTTPGS